MVYWARNGNDGFGKPAYLPPVNVQIRWEDKLQEILLADGRKVIAKAYILSTTELVPGSLVLLAPLQTADSLVWYQTQPFYPGYPTFNQGGRELLKVNTTPDIRAVSVIFESYV